MKRIEEAMWEDFNRYSARCDGCRHNSTCSKQLRIGEQEETLSGCSAYFPATDPLWL